MKIRCNNIPRDILTWYDLTDAERSDLDYVDTEDRQADFSGFRYRGSVYDLGEFMAVRRYGNPGWDGWDGYHADSFFSAVVIRYPRETWGEIDTEHVIVGVAYS